MIKAKNGINRRLTSRMSKIHPWMICFDVPMPQEVFNLLNKEVVNRTSYGIDVSEKPGSVTITLKNMRRLCSLFKKFEDCEAFTEEQWNTTLKRKSYNLISITGTAMHLASFSIETT